MTTDTWKIPDEAVGERLDRFAAQMSGMTRSAIQSLADDGAVTVNGRKAPKNYRLRSGDEVTVAVPEPTVYEARPENIPLDIVYEDADLLVVNKPKGMVVHPAAGNYDGTLVNALLYHCHDLSGINGVLRPGIVHRIDKDTSGLLIVAKNDRAHQGLAEQIKVHSFTRIYEAIVYGRLRDDSGTVNAPIGRHPTKRKQMAVTPVNSKPAVTHYEVIARYDGNTKHGAFTHVRLRLETGRTHQIRVHMAYLGHPIAGDPLYGVKKAELGLTSQCLHARELTFVHPRSGEEMTLTCPLPEEFRHALDILSRQI